MKQKNYLIGAFLVSFFCYFIFLLITVPEKGRVFFSVFAFCLCAIVFEVIGLLSFLRKRTIESYFFSLPVIKIGIFHILTQYILGVFICFFLVDNFKTAICIQLVIFAVFTTIELYLAFAGMNAEQIEEKAVGNTLNMKKITQKIKFIVDETTDFEWKQKVKPLYEKIKYSNPVTSGNSVADEKQIFDKLDELQSAIQLKDEMKFEKISKEISGCLFARGK